MALYFSAVLFSGKKQGIVETDHSDQEFSCTSSEDDVESFSSSEEDSTGIMGKIVANVGKLR